jgi:hypothetical protein
LHAFEDRHREVIITRPNVVPIGGQPESWRAHRLGVEIASGDYLRYFLDDLDALGLPEVMVSQS